MAILRPHIEVASVIFTASLSEPYLREIAGDVPCLETLFRPPPPQSSCYPACPPQTIIVSRLTKLSQGNTCLSLQVCSCICCRLAWHPVIHVGVAIRSSTVETWREGLPVLPPGTYAYGTRVVPPRDMGPAFFPAGPTHVPRSGTSHLSHPRWRWYVTEALVYPCGGLCAP
ncbi:hypothetical protein BC834DRAFT_145043 [Gloeopeniophorella convolvens]|nr:hypothetical protein BC834DRAFT_145043 [Gloeopeniophorella convolvens]